MVSGIVAYADKPSLSTKANVFSPFNNALASPTPINKLATLNTIFPWLYLAWLSTAVVSSIYSPYFPFTAS